MVRTVMVEQLNTLGCRVQEREPLSAHTTFHIGGAATLFVTAETAEQVAARMDVPIDFVFSCIN